MPLGDFLAGAAFFLSSLAAALTAAAVLVRARYGHLPGPSRWLAFAVLATAALMFAHVVPAALGILTRPTVLVCAVLGLAGAVGLSQHGRSRRAAASDPSPAPPPSAAASVAVAALAVGAAAVYELARLRVQISMPLTFVDVAGFHLPGVARWMQTGSLWQIDQFWPGFATAQYPNNGDFLLLSTVLPWHDLAFVRIAMLPFYLLTAIGTYALAIELRATRAAAATFAAAAATVPAISFYAYQGLPDPLALAMLPVGLVFLVRHERHRRRSDLLLGGLALGLSFGAKWYGVTSVVVVLGVWGLMWLTSSRRRGAGGAGGGLGGYRAEPANGRPKRPIGDFAVIVGAIVLGGGIWIVRNVVESGNPIYPKTVSPFGIHLFTGSSNDVVNRYGYSVAHYLAHPRILRDYILPGFESQVGIAGAAVLVGVVALVVASVWPAVRSGGQVVARRPCLAIAAIAIGICALYAITPGSGYGPKNRPIAAAATLRWLMPAVIVGAAAAAAAVRRLGRFGLLLELVGLAGVAHGIYLGDRIGAGAFVEAAFALAVGGLLIGGRSRIRAAVGGLPGSGFRVGVAVALAVVLVAAMRFEQTRFDRHGYAGFDPAYAWLDAHAASGHTVGVAGQVSTATTVVPLLPAFGPRLGNHVGYVGDTVVHTLEYPANQRSFAADLRRGRYDLLEIGLDDTHHADAWASQSGFRLIFASRRLAIYARSRPATAPPSRSSR